MVLMFLYNDTNLVNVDVRGRQEYYGISNTGFEHRYEGEKNYTQSEEMYPYYMYQDFGSWGHYALTKSYPKPKMFAYDIRTRMKNDDTCQIGVSYKALQEITHDDLVLHVAILEDGVPNSFENSSLGKKIDTCDNILRKMLPSSEGSFLGAVPIDDSGDVVLSFDRAEINLVDLEKSRLVVFVQSRNGKIVYETKRFDNHPFQELGEWDDTQIMSNINPAFSKGITVKDRVAYFDKKITKGSTFSLINCRGQVLSQHFLSYGTSNIKLPYLPKGLYFFQLNNAEDTKECKYIVD